MANIHYLVRICNFPECKFPPNIELRKVLKEEISFTDLANKAKVVETGCTGHCAPFIMIEEIGGYRYLYGDLTPQCLKEIIKNHLINDQPDKERAVLLD